MEISLIEMRRNKEGMPYREGPLASVKENEQFPFELRQAALETLTARSLPMGEPSTEQLEAINAEVLRRGREFLQRYDSAETRWGLERRAASHIKSLISRLARRMALTLDLRIGNF